MPIASCRRPMKKQLRNTLSIYVEEVAAMMGVQRRAGHSAFKNAFFFLIFKFQRAKLTLITPLLSTIHGI